MAEPFEWMETPRLSRRATATSDTRDDEIRRRAFIFATLGYTQKQAEARLRQNALWEHERIGKPTILKRLSSLVAESYQRAGAGKKKKK